MMFMSVGKFNYSDLFIYTFAVLLITLRLESINLRNIYNMLSKGNCGMSRAW